MDKRKRNVKTIAAILLLTMAMLTTMSMISNVKADTQNIPLNLDFTPGYNETSEYMIGSVAVGIILPESDGTKEPETENWTPEEKGNVTNQIQIALNWWTNQSQYANINVSFINETSVVPTGYEPVNHLPNFEPWINDVMSNLGFPPSDDEPWEKQTRNYANDLRYRRNTDWAFAIFIVDNSNDPNKTSASSLRDYPSIFMTAYYGSAPINTSYPKYAHEIGHRFWAADEKTGFPITYQGYLGVRNLPGFDGLMGDYNTLILSGYPEGNDGTWGQVGWRDSNGNGILDIVDTPQNVYINSSTMIENKIQYNGTATVTPYPNNNTQGSKRDVTINKIQSVQYRIDNEPWSTATMTPSNPSTNVSFTFQVDLTTLSPGIHTINISATNQWNISGYVNETFSLNNIIDITKITASNSTITVTIENNFGSNVTADVAVTYNRMYIDPPENLTHGTNTRTYPWNYTTGYYQIIATADAVLPDGTICIGFNTTVFPERMTSGSQSSLSDMLAGNWVIFAFGIFSAGLVVPELSKKKKPDDELTTTEAPTENMWQNLARHQLT